MGGTSCDVCLIVDGEPLYSSDFEIEFGLPVSVPSVSTRTIGAGGGSIGWVDPGGFLQVGPQSAGADPGPAAYGRGGTEATVTDANLILGRLDPDFFLGGRMQLQPELARTAIARLGERLGLDETETASAIIRVTNENMANAIRIVTVEEGIDPRGFALVAIGGAGATHGCEIADAIGMSRVVVPPSSGLCSAFGAIAASVRVDAVRSVYLTDRRTTAAELDGLFRELEREAHDDVAAQGASEQPAVRRAIAMRYQGQNYEQEVIVPPGAIDDAALTAIYADYGRLYEEFYGYRLDGIPIEAGTALRGRNGGAAGVRHAPPRAGDGWGRDDARGVLSRPRLRGDARRPPREPRAGRARGWPADRRVDGLDRRRPPEWSLQLCENGILDLTRR